MLLTLICDNYIMVAKTMMTTSATRTSDRYLGPPRCQPLCSMSYGLALVNFKMTLHDGAGKWLNKASLHPQGWSVVEPGFGLRSVLITLLHGPPPHSLRSY